MQQVVISESTFFLLSFQQKLGLFDKDEHVAIFSVASAEADDIELELGLVI